MFKVLLQADASAPGMGGNYSFLLMMVALFAVMYFLMIRPQQKRQKELRAFQSSLQKGAKVVISGGIYGTVVEIKETSVLVEVDNNVKLRVDKGSVVRDPSDMPAAR
ncbi:MAG: preprotein translocase subunit YajC [Bacteroidales bacterium]|nr:preprotein translocase subunit YajC [Bacteroidales bacterium]MCL2738953.1 preprotein translocase subunit YajC [Bacteroidales bacterium]